MRMVIWLLSSRTETLIASSREKALIMLGPQSRTGIAKISCQVRVRMMTPAQKKVKNNAPACTLIIRMINVKSLLLMSLLAKGMPIIEPFFQIPKKPKNLSLHNHHQPYKRQHLPKKMHLYKNHNPCTNMCLNQSLHQNQIFNLCISESPSKNLYLFKSRKSFKSQ